MKQKTKRSLWPVITIVIFVALTLALVYWGTRSSETEEPESPYLTFPAMVTDSTLEIEAVRSYKGTFVEDGSDRPVEGVAAIVVTNTGKEGVEYASLRFDGTAAPLEFKVTGLRPGATAVVMELNAAPFVEQQYYGIAADVATIPAFAIAPEVQVEEQPDGQLQITNLTDRDFPSVRIFYKYFRESDEIYLGGITYTAPIDDLKAGEVRSVHPAHYLAGHSQVIMAKVYEEGKEQP